MLKLVIGLVILLTVAYIVLKTDWLSKNSLENYETTARLGYDSPCTPGSVFWNGACFTKDPRTNMIIKN